MTPPPLPESPTPSPVSTSPTPAPTYPEDTNPVRPRPAHTVCDNKNFICVGSHLVNATLPISFVATGTAIAFENTFQWKLLDATDAVVAGGTLMTNAPDIGQPGPFALNYNLEALRSGPHTLRFYESSAKDGSPMHILNIPIQF